VGAAVTDERSVTVPRVRLRLIRTVAAVGLLGAACGGGSASSGAVGTRAVSPLAIVEVATPRLLAPGFVTAGTYPKLTGGSVELQAVNAALRAAVLADQRAYVSGARAVRAYLNRYRPPAGGWRGVYRTDIDLRLVSASTVVVSALLRRRAALYRYRDDRWLPITIQVPSGNEVEISDLFADPVRGRVAFAEAWRAEMRRQGHGRCVDLYDAYETGAFALTADGLAVGVDEAGFCGPLRVTLSYRRLRQYLSTFGRELIAGVRRPNGLRQS
jgi:hypothetical protein